MAVIDESLLPLNRLYHWEATQPRAIYLSQPLGGGRMRDYHWAQVADEARRMAAYLKSFGWEPGTRVAILSKNCAWWVMSDLAIWMAGYVSVPIYPTLTADSVKQILQHSESRACFVGKLDDWNMMRAGVVGSAVKCIRYPLSPAESFPEWDEIVARTEPLPGNPLRRADDLATIVYTSGTTGMPKGVMHLFSSIAWSAESLRQRFGSRPDDRMLSYLPLAHVAERWVVEAGSLSAGSRVFFAESLDTFPQDLRRARPTVFISVPRLWVKFQQGVYARMPKENLERLLKIPLLGSLVKRKILAGMGLDRVRFAGGGAAPMPPDLLKWYHGLGLELLEGYGMTENFGCSHSNLPGQGKPGYVGVTYPGVECRIGEGGEVQMRSPALMTGYFKEPEKTRETLTEDGFLRTGDKGEIDAEGRLRITGRVKDLFKTSKGKYVAPSPIEDRLVTHPTIEACCVVGANYPQPMGIVMLSQDAVNHARGSAEREALAASLGQHLEKINAELDPHEQMDCLAVVTEQWTVENGFITPTLKVKRPAIECNYAKYFDGWLRQKKPVVWASST